MKMVAEHHQHFLLPPKCTEVAPPHTRVSSAQLTVNTTDILTNSKGTGQREIDMRLMWCAFQRGAL